MVIFLTSFLNTHLKDENGQRIPHPIENENEILTNLKRFLGETRRLVFVANDPNDTAENEAKSQVAFESFQLSGWQFTENLLLDARNQKHAKEIILGADLIILGGGKCLCQNQFFRQIGLKKILKQYQGVVIGISAGSMNLGQKVANFPEELADLKEPRWLPGLGQIDAVIIPHFDGASRTYQISCNELDVTNDYLLPMSHRHDLLGIANGSYLFIDQSGKVHYFGNICRISHGVICDLTEKSGKIGKIL